MSGLVRVNPSAVVDVVVVVSSLAAVEVVEEASDFGLEQPAAIRLNRTIAVLIARFIHRTIRCLSCEGNGLWLRTSEEFRILRLCCDSK
jgi:hypothetical protein